MEERRMFRGVMTYLDPKWNTSGEGSFPLMIDAEERRCR